MTGKEGKGFSHVKVPAGTLIKDGESLGSSG